MGYMEKLLIQANAEQSRSAAQRGRTFAYHSAGSLERVRPETEPRAGAADPQPGALYETEELAVSISLRVLERAPYSLR